MLVEKANEESRSEILLAVRRDNKIKIKELWRCVCCCRCSCCDWRRVGKVKMQKRAVLLLQVTEYNNNYSTVKYAERSKSKSNQQKAAQIKRKLAQKIRKNFTAVAALASRAKTKRNWKSVAAAVSTDLCFCFCVSLLLLCSPKFDPQVSPYTHMGQAGNAFESKIFFRSVTVIF